MQNTDGEIFLGDPTTAAEREAIYETICGMRQEAGASTGKSARQRPCLDTLAVYGDGSMKTYISDAMTALWKDDALRADLIARGRARRELFSWQQTADRLWSCIEKVL